MNKLETIINKARDGGYKDADYLLMKDELYGYIYELESECFLLDPLFFQALGKASEWENKSSFNDGIEIHHDDSRKNWQHHALEFHRINLTQSLDHALDYLSQTLLSDKLKPSEIWG